MGAVIVALFALAGAGKAVSDAVAHGSARLSERGPWWNNATSWTLKYRDYYGGDKRPRYIGATTWLVCLSDAWHFFNAVTWAAIDAALLVGAWPVCRWYAVVAVLARRVVFEPLYALLRRQA